MCGVMVFGTCQTGQMSIELSRLRKYLLVVFAPRLAEPTCSLPRVDRFYTVRSNI